MLKEDGDKKCVNVVMDEDDYKILKVLAKKEERSVASLCRLILKNYPVSKKEKMKVM